VGLILSGIHELLAYAADVNLLGDNIDTIIEASKEVVLHTNIEKTKYVLLTCQQKVGQRRDINVANRLFGNDLQFKYLGMTTTNPNFIR
jgi:hypothetical protein